MARVMILEDEPSLRRFLAIYLESQGHAVTFEAGSGHVGLQHLARDPEGTDVILSDLRMPIADGLDVLAGSHTLAARRGPPVRVVLASGYWAEEEVALARDLGAHALLAKPFDLELLARTIAEGAVATAARETRSPEAKKAA